MPFQLKRQAYGVLIGLTVLVSCVNHDSKVEATTYDFPNPVDTNNKSINEPERGIFDLGDGVFIRTDFPSARLDKISRVNDTLLSATVAAENYPINNSPWYAFKAWSEEETKVYLKLGYVDATHRYQPKFSKDGLKWSTDTTLVERDSSFTFSMDLSKDTLWVGAQELYDSKRVRNWAEEVATDRQVRLSAIGRSSRGKDLLLLDINSSSSSPKDVIVILSRQHPPEVTGFFAMQAFVESILSSDMKEEFLKSYRVLIYPLLNPDGVDMGHWRHNANGIDLNRDWAYYRQSETRAIANDIVNRVKESGGKVILGLDFHSTWDDVFYTQDKQLQPTATTPWFREQWFQRLEEGIPGYQVNERPKGLATPVTKGWFYTQFGAEGMTYEIGDHTPKALILKIGQITSEAMMEILMSHE